VRLIVLAAGRGSRFSAANILTPKPLIDFRGNPLFWWATKSALSSKKFNEIEFVVLQEHIKNFSIDKIIKRYFPNSVIRILEEVTGGAAETAALVAQDLPPNESIAFCDCDLGFAFKNHKQLNHLLRTPISAAVCIFKSKNPAYSYVLTDDYGHVVKIEEKKNISTNAIAGLYIFVSASLYLSEFYKYKKKSHNDELYISGVLNTMINSGLQIGCITVTSHLSFGTPEELRLEHKKLLPKWVDHKNG